MLASGGDLNAGFKGAIGGALFGAAGTIGDAMSPERYLAHAGAGCLQGVVSGGDCGRGAASAVAGKLATNYTEGNPVATVVAGGTVSAIGGGKFANGAITAAFGYLFNQAAHAAAEGAAGTAGQGLGGWLGGIGRGLGRVFGALGTLLSIDQVAENNAYIYHYTTEGGRDGIIRDGYIRTSPDGFVYVTPDFYTSGDTAQQRLALSRTPQGYLMVPFSNINGALPPQTVQSWNGQPGGGVQVKVPHDVSSRGVRWIPIGP